jgi:hypothetical protein
MSVVDIVGPRETPLGGAGNWCNVQSRAATGDLPKVPIFNGSLGGVGGRVLNRRSFFRS